MATVSVASGLSSSFSAFTSSALDGSSTGIVIKNAASLGFSAGGSTVLGGLTSLASLSSSIAASVGVRPLDAIPGLPVVAGPKNPLRLPLLKSFSALPDLSSNSPLIGDNFTPVAIDMDYAFLATQTNNGVTTHIAMVPSVPNGASICLASDFFSPRASTPEPFLMFNFTYGANSNFLVRLTAAGLIVVAGSTWLNTSVRAQVLALNAPAGHVNAQAVGYYCKYCLFPRGLYLFIPTGVGFAWIASGPPIAPAAPYNSPFGSITLAASNWVGVAVSPVNYQAAAGRFTFYQPTLISLAEDTTIFMTSNFSVMMPAASTLSSAPGELLTGLVSLNSVQAGLAAANPSKDYMLAATVSQIADDLSRSPGVPAFR